MPATRLPAWLERDMAEYVESRMQAGETREQAEANKQQSRDRGSRAGLPPRAPVWDVIDQDDTVVGYLWIGPLTPGEHRLVGVRRRDRRGTPAPRARPAGTRTRAPRRADNGATSIGLNVFGYNTGAQELYAALGYQVTSAQMRKPLV